MSGTDTKYANYTGDKHVNGIPSLPIDNRISNRNTDIGKRLYSAIQLLENGKKNLTKPHGFSYPIKTTYYHNNEWQHRHGQYNGRVIESLNTCNLKPYSMNSPKVRIRHGRDHMAFRFTTTYAISAYHHWCCEFQSRSGRGVQHYMIKFVSDLLQVHKCS